MLTARTCRAMTSSCSQAEGTQCSKRYKGKRRATEMTASGEEAVALLEGDKAKYRALLTDVHLAGTLTGWDLAKHARELNPDIPVIYMTGAGADQHPSHGVPNSLLLNKPFAPAQVVTAVSQLLNQAPPLHE
jgi:CheY-like chemotaxis protein